MRRLALPLILSALALAAVRAQAQSVVYNIALPDLGASLPQQINTAGQLAGASYLPSSRGVIQTPFVWKDGVLTRMDLPALVDGTRLESQTVTKVLQNASGVALFTVERDVLIPLGGIWGSQPSTQTWEWSGGQFHQVDMSVGTFSAVTSLNDVGNKAGQVLDLVSGTVMAYVTIDGTTSVIATPGAVATLAGPLNNRNQVAGLVGNNLAVWQPTHVYPDTPLQAFTWSNGQSTSIGTLFSIEGFNDHGDVLGLRQRTDGSKQLTLIKNGQDIDLLPEFQAVSGRAWLTNDGMVVSDFSSESNGSFERSVYVINGQETFLLEDLVDPNRKLEDLSVLAVNDKGEIVATGYDKLTGQTVTAVLTPHPIPEPGTYLLVGLGLLAAGAAARYRREPVSTPAAA